METAILNGGAQALRGYTYKGTYASANAVSEFVDLVKLPIDGAFTFQHPHDLRIVSLQADQATSNYTVAIADLNSNTYFSNTYEGLVIAPDYLIVPANHKVTITPNSNTTRLRFIAQYIAVLDQILLR